MLPTIFVFYFFFAYINAIALPVTPTSAASSSVCTPTQAVRDGSFEKGIGPWTATGGAVLKSNSDASLWGFSATKGTHYIQLESSANLPNSTLTQTVSSLSFYTPWTLSYDWSFDVSTTGDGPPSTTCTLSAMLGPYTVASWTRPGSQGGEGHVAETLTINFTEAELVFYFGCTSLAYEAGIRLDNVLFKGFISPPGGC